MNDTGRLWPRPVLAMLPDTVSGVAEHDVDLGGIWKITTQPPKNFWENGVVTNGWQDIPVPGETPVYGIRPENFKEYAYRTSFTVPEDFAGKVIKMRFDGANCQARVFIDGAFVRSHYGGFNSWDADVTDFVTPGATHILTVGMENRAGEMSGFATGGLIRTVRLLAFPRVHVERLHARTDFVSGYENAKLTIMTKVSQKSDAKIALSVSVPDGAVRDLGVHDIGSGEDVSLVFDFENVKTWDSEHPNLYIISASVTVDGEVVETLTRKFGFREVKVVGNRMFVNGDEVKLRGSDRHDSHPLLGHALTHEQIDADIQRFREANVNLIRTSHYNPCQYFLDRCDEVGMYVELETSVCFIGQGQDMVCDDPHYAPKFMDQFAESIEMNLSRPAVIMWSLSNECIWGQNFKLEQDYVHQEDPTRPTVFSYPVTIRDEDDMVDIWSVHYALEDMDPSLMTDCMYRGINFGSRPVLHDEFIHVPCYIFQTRECDIGVRDAWGETVTRFWDKIYDTEGALGGAIWCGLDDYVYTPQGTHGLMWGVQDAFRRNKPETWLVKKGYTPIYIKNEPVGRAENGVITVPVRNRYNHRNLCEIRCEWEIAGKSGVCYLPAAKPTEWANLSVNVGEVAETDHLTLRFYEPDGLMADAYEMKQVEEPVSVPALSGRAPIVVDGDELVASGSGFEIAFSKETGKITSGKYNGEPVILHGPELNLKGRGVGVYQWKLDEMKYNVSDALVIDLKGTYGKIKVSFRITVDDTGLIKTDYVIDDIPFNSPRAIVMINGDDIGGYLEVGMYYVLTHETEKLAWEKTGLHNYYPDWHIGRLKGVADKIYEPAMKQMYPAVPEWEWQLDMKDFPLYSKDDLGGRGTRDFISGKTEIYRAAAGREDYALAAYSDGTHQVRMELEMGDSVINSDDPRVKYYGNWYERRDLHGLYKDHEMLSKTPGNYVEVEFEGTGIEWHGCKYMTHGQAEVWIDGRKEAVVDLFSGRPSNSSRGRERLYGMMLFARDGLAPGKHVLKIVVTGGMRKIDPMRPGLHAVQADSCYVSVDYFRVTEGLYGGNVRMYVNNEWNHSDLHWGCYMKPPVLVDPGYSGTSYVRMEKLGKE